MSRTIIDYVISCRNLLVTYHDNKRVLFKLKLCFCQESLRNSLKHMHTHVHTGTGVSSTVTITTILLLSYHCSDRWSYLTAAGKQTDMKGMWRAIKP